MTAIRKLHRHFGPFYNEFTLYSRTVAKDSEEKFDSLDLGVRWYKLVSPDQIECIDILDEEDYAIKPELFIRDAGVPAFVLFGDDIKINPVVKNSGVEEAGPFFVSLYIKDIQIDTKVINGLAVGQQEAVEFSIPSDDYFGVYVAKIVADAYKDIDELNENNNEEQVSFLVGYNIFNVIMNYNNTDLVVDERQMLILDRLGKAVEEASVTIQTPRGQIMTLTTDDSGVIEFLLDSPGDYTVQVSKENFETFNGSFAVPPLNIQFKKTVSSGSIQEIQVLGADGTPVTDAVIKIIGPDGREELYYTDDRGIVSFRASSTGTYDFEIIRKNVILLLGSFISAGIVEVTMSFGSQGMEAIVGQEILSHPELLLMLLAMCFVAALIAYTKSKMLFKKGVKSTRQKKIEHYLRLALAAAFFFLPLQVGKFFGFAGAVAFVLFEIMLFIVLDYYHQNVAKRRKAIKV